MLKLISTKLCSNNISTVMSTGLTYLANLPFIYCHDLDSISKISLLVNNL